MSETEFKVKCVQCKNEEVSSRCTEAFNALKAYGFKPQWITEDECLNVMQKDKNTVYLCDKFEGDAFEHLKSHGLRILGPICVLTCLELKVEIPRTKVPIHNLAMKDTIISCTNIDKVLRESLHMKILMMGGEIQRNFTETVTHLVAGMVGSSKYQVASNLKKYIMLPDWVNSVWEASQEGSVHCNDEKFQKYTCPMFKGLIITVSGLESTERKKVKQLVEMEGGVYSGEMKVDECTHLIVNEPKGQKFEFAKQWKIQIVKPKWLYESIETGYCLDETQYQLNTETSGGYSRMKTSTPTKNASAVNLSSIANISVITRIGDSVFNSCNSTISQVEKPSKLNFDVDTSSISTSILDGCKIYLSGFRGPDQEQLLRIINVGGGTRFNSLNEHVTHVVMGEIVPADMDYLEKATHRPHMINASWLLDCMKESKYIPEKPYYIQNLPFVKESHMEPPKAPAPITKRKTVVDVSQLNTTKVNATTIEFGDNTDEELALMSQYLHGPAISKSEARKGTTKSSIVSNVNSMSNGTFEPDQLEMTDPVNTGGIFSGKTFICCGLGEDTPVVEGAITENGGIILRNLLHIPDYALTPLGGCTVKFTANEVVTHVWLETCLEKQCLVPVSDNVLFHPIEIKCSVKPLTNCVISFSGLTSVEKNCLMYLGRVLGASTQLVFVKKPTKGMLSNTHLVVKEAEGPKYEAAIKWKVHVVKIEWILACAKSGKLEPEDNYICKPVTCKDDITSVEENNVRNSTFLTGNDGNGSITKKRTSVSDVRPNHLANEASSTCNDIQPQCDNIVMEGLASTDSSQKENRHSLSHKQMPISLQTSRILELQEKDGQLSPKQNNFQPKIDTETPSKFLGQGKEYHPKYELDDLTSVLESQMKGLSTSHSRRSSIRWDELFSKHIEEAVKISANARTEEYVDSQEAEAVSDKNEGPLTGVVISVARKLSAKQSLYNDMAVSLGADYTWTYDDSCTHFIFQGKQNDINKEFRLARDQKKIIVSPYWLIMCKEQNVYVDESLFPHTFNPNLNLQSVMNNAKETPRRRMRSTRAEVCSSTPVAKKTPRVFRQDVEEAVPKQDAEGEKIETNALLHVTAGEELMEVEETNKPDVENAVEMAEIQEALNKELENIKASGSRRTKKRNKKLNSSCNDSLNNRSTPFSTKVAATSKTAEQSSKTNSSESSQSVQVTWYDPTERIEMQKVAAQLERAYCPTQDTLEGFTTPKQDCDGQPTNGNGELNDDGKKISSRTSTPEQPSIVLPLSKKLETVAAPQPIEFLSDDDTQDSTTAGTMVESPCFLLSGISPSERVDYGALIEELGGTVIEGQIYHESCTHLVIGCPARNEKFLACMASGKWILHKSYFEDCRRAKKFVQEAKHEWGSVSTESVLASANSVMKSLAASAQRWRLKIQELKKQNPECLGAFYDWSVILCTCKKKESNFERLLKAGGAMVLSAKPPFTKPISATHALIDITRADLTSSDLETLLRNNVLCLRPDYIAAYLSNEVLQSPDEFCPPEVIALRASLNLPDSGMRKRKSTITGEDAKRNRKL